MGLDTGTTWTMLKTSILKEIGHDPEVGQRVQIVTVSGIEFTSRVRISLLEAAGLERRNFPVLCKSLPPAARIDGLLGLDFLRGRKLTVDFGIGEMILE